MNQTHIDNPTLPPTVNCSLWPVPYADESEEQFRQRIARSCQNVAVSLPIPHVHWLIIGYLGFRTRRSSEKDQEHLVITMLREFFAIRGLDLENGGWVLRKAVDTRGDRQPRYHFLLGGYRLSKDLRAFCRYLAGSWEKISGGRCRITPYVPTPEAVWRGFKYALRSDIPDGVGEGVIFSPALSALMHSSIEGDGNTTGAS
jgi:hypothetical protein